MIFVDTWAWLALAYAKDPYHPIATLQHQMLQKANQTNYVTTNFVLSEFISLLFGVTPFVAAHQFVDRLLQTCRQGLYQLVHISQDQFERAWQMRVKYHDKPDISLVDFTSMVVMQDLGINEVFSGDRHFLQVGLGFRLIP